jgi:hypothetical protein
VCLYLFYQEGALRRGWQLILITLSEHHLLVIQHFYHLPTFILHPFLPTSIHYNHSIQSSSCH